MERLNHNLAAKPASERLGYLAFVLTACVFAVFFVMPIVWSFANSFKPAAAALADPAALFSKAFSLENYRRLEHVGAGWYVYAGNSVLIAAGTVLLTVLVSVPAGYGFSKFRFPGQSLLFVLIMATMMIPFQSILTPLFLILKVFRLQNNLFGLVLIYVTFQLPFSVFMMRNAFDAVPKALIEAARIDGASQATILRRIMLPIALPGVATVAMFAFLNSWNEFLAALIFPVRSEQVHAADHAGECFVGHLWHHRLGRASGRYSRDHGPLHPAFPSLATILRARPDGRCREVTALVPLRSPHDQLTSFSTGTRCGTAAIQARRPFQCRIRWRFLAKLDGDGSQRHHPDTAQAAGRGGLPRGARF
ncbi:ABC-type glycerol-3-phosphate transport system permease component [Rhizobium beringeri]